MSFCRPADLLIDEQMQSLLQPLLVRRRNFLLKLCCLLPIRLYWMKIPASFYYAHTEGREIFRIILRILLWSDIDTWYQHTIYSVQRMGFTQMYSTALALIFRCIVKSD